MQEDAKKKLTLTDVSVGYGKKIVIHNVAFSIAPGEIVTLVGPNGAGKSTVLKTIVGQLESMGGTITLMGERLSNLKEKEIAKSMAMVMTERLKTELMSCREVVESGRYPYTGTFGILSKEDARLVDEAMEMVHATELQNMDFMQLSDGQRQRVMLARAIAQQPEVLVLDEPTSFLDMKYKMEILTIIERLAKEKHMAVLLSLHELEFAKAISDKVACIKGAEIACIGTPHEVLTPAYLRTLFDMEMDKYDERFQAIFERMFWE